MNTTTSPQPSFRIRTTAAGQSTVAADLASGQGSAFGAKALALLLLAEALLSFAPLAVLGPAIGWPASLRADAATQLQSVHQHGGAVALGYSLYLLYSVLIAPVMIGLAARCLGGLQRPLAATVAALGALSAGARAVGILRWLTVMPALAAAHATADGSGKATLEWIFRATTLYGGGIGEVLGVSLFMAAGLGLLCGAAWRVGRMPMGLALAGGLVALALAGLALPTLGVPVQAPVAAAVSGLSAWMVACAVWCWRKA